MKSVRQIMSKSPKTGFTLIATVLLISLYVTFFTDRSGLELSQDYKVHTRVNDDFVISPEDMELKALYKTINLIEKRYIDPARINPKKMFIEAMQSVSNYVPEILAKEEKQNLQVRAGTMTQKFATDDLSTTWVLLQRLRDALVFVRKHLTRDDIKFSRIQYAAINGMLHTLDPHSTLLPPEVYRDMKDKTQGKFGGLGIVISIRDGYLTVISPLDGTPADKAGIKAGDRIVEIDKISTINMSLNDAVGMLRGKPGTKVSVHIKRKLWTESRPFVITRDIIVVKSVESHFLKDNIGYVRIKDFQGNTINDLNTHLAKLEKKHIHGLVLDLRNDPGGLLSAAINVADRFLTKGVIVTTAGHGPGQRDISRAKNQGKEPEYPLVVLINSGSASASEIVAGALKNHKRALLVGRKTYGKGSVQVLYDLNDGSALKLTTAQYLTPGDVSIQSVGVVPHLELLPMRADEEILDLVIQSGYRESDLKGHLGKGSNSALKSKPVSTLKYLFVEREKSESDDEIDLPEQNKNFVPDAEINMARQLVLKMLKKKIFPDDLSAFLENYVKNEKTNIDIKLNEKLGKLGVDWSMGPNKEPASVTASLELDKDPLNSGENYSLVLKVQNEGPGTIYRLHAVTRSDFAPLHDREIAIGKIQPGEEIIRKLKFKVPQDVLDRIDDVVVSFNEAHGQQINPVSKRFSVKSAEHARFSHIFHLNDDENGNGDGLIQKRETIKMLVDIENVGKGESKSTYATLKAESDSGVFMKKGREFLDKMKPGEKRTAAFSFEIKKTFNKDKLKLDLAIADTKMRVYYSRKINLPIAQKIANTNSAQPPDISVLDVPRVTTENSITINGKAFDDISVRSVLFYLESKKVNYFLNTDNKLKTINFNVKIKLDYAVNYINIIARDNQGMETHRTLVVRRDGKNGEKYFLSLKRDNPPVPLSEIK